MADLEITVRYKSPVARAGLMLSVLSLPVWGILIPIGLIVGLIPLLVGFLLPGRAGYIIHSGVYALGPVLGLILITVLGVKSVLNFSDDRIVVSKLGIQLPFFLGSTFGLRRTFAWAAVNRAELIDRHGKREIVIYTSDGFPVYLDIKCIAPHELEQLLVGFDVWAPNCEKSPELELLQDELQKCSDQKSLPSYTQMWDEELSRRFASTAYVPLEPGQVLQSGRLKVVNQLSFGGLSAVYLCQRDGRDLVVLKEAVVPDDNDDELQQKALELFVRESRLLMQLEHPAIVKVVDHFVESGRHYLLIEYRSGQDLNQFVKQNGAQSEERVLEWALQIVDILHYLHTQDPPIIHRDVTPDNLVLGVAGVEESIVMIDFGAANEFLSQATGTLVGKQSFIAPEQFRGKATVQSDLYALGCTLHFLLTATEPIPLSVSHPRAISPVISEAVDKLVADLTAVDADNRMRTAGEARQRIQELLVAQRPQVAVAAT